MLPALHLKLYMTKFKKFALKVLLSIFTFITVGGSLFYVQPAKAFPVEITWDPGYVWSVYKGFIKDAAVSISVQTFSYFLRRIAYDSAVWVASGGKGQSPFAHYKDFGGYMSDVGDNAAGVAIEALGTDVGFNLCKIPDPKIDLAMRIGLTYKFMDLMPKLNTLPGAKKPTCTWSSFQNDVLSADNWQSQFGSSDDVARKFNVAFDIEQTDIGILMSATEKIDGYVAEQAASAKLSREEGQGYLAKTGLISGNIITPAKNIADYAESLNPDKQAEAAQQGFLATLGTGAVGSIVSAGGLFLNTLATQMMSNWQTKGMLPFGVGCIGGVVGAECKTLQDTLNNLQGQVSRGGLQTAQALFSDLLTPPNIAVDQYNVLVNFTNCPTSPAPDNCVIDAALAQAAQEAGTGKTVTIAQALEKNWLHGEWKLISPDRSADNVDPTCHQRAYCYANIAKLRKARVVPLGFEIAALKSNPDKPWTLKQVVDGFNDCNFIRDASGKVIGVENDPTNKPFCHLIDPEWVIKAPPSKCNFMAYGSSPYFAGTPNRAQECVDMTTCVAYDKDGNCATQGYCTREKNVWRIDAGKCDSQFRTCRSFQDSTGKAVSYLYRTLNTGFCTQETVGCSQYSLKKNNAGAWVGYSNTDLNTVGENSAIYFNNKVSTNCSSNSDGCSSFQVADGADQLYLRKAPYYSGCYDTNTATLAIDWPSTLSGINRLPNNPECNNYSSACIADEVNCNWYAPSSYTGDAIPGKFTPATVVEDQIVWNDQCDKRCVGYAAYREMQSNYSNGSPVSYIIPSSGLTCNAVDEGCASFTNLSATEGGLEKVDYFSYLRPCILPDPARQKNFFTYEGSAVGGFQLKSFILEKDTDGSPKYFYRTPADRAGYDAICTEALYRSGLASPDCRQFNDDQGVVYYKLLSKTIAVSTACTPYRLNDVDLYMVALNATDCATQRGLWDAAAGTCQVCFQNGEYRDGQCFYNGLPGGNQNNAGTSKVCSASVNTCRAYKGNAGNNVRNVFSDNFEESVPGDALLGWGPAFSTTQSLESTHAGEHSLSYLGAAAATKDLDLTPGRSYDLTFWAKGSIGQTITVTLDNGQVSTLGTVSIGDVWQNFHLGPVELNGIVTSTRLNFRLESNGQLFLDNVSLKEITDYIYLVKNTLEVNPVCDSNINDNLPGEALGCSQYQTPDNKPMYLTGFTSLCREKAIGCTALVNTYNTPDEPISRAYNVWIPGLGNENVSRTILDRTYSCQISLDQTGCYVIVEGATLAEIITGGGLIVTSTIYIQPDNPTSTPIYLVANKESSCNAVDLGCVKAGKLVQGPIGPTYTEVMVKSDPASFKTILCQSEAVGCNAYSSIEGALYFKDPETVGQKVCAYRDSVTKNGVKYNGWFWKGVGRCNTGLPNSALCASDTDCATGIRCENKDEQACYPNYLQTGNSYGLWSYGVSTSYDNFVGECPAVQNGCTEYIDRNENNKTYYLINDDRLKKQQNECNGAISEKSGCILLDKTDSPNKLWNTAGSYAASAAQNNGLVAPVVATGVAINDANTILKVSRDRECGEWLQCRSSHRVFDSQSGSYKETCDFVGRCNKASPPTVSGDFINCANWLDNNHELSGQILTDDAYRNRSTDWKGQDFSGYSILNVFPIEELSEVNFGSTLAPDWRLVKTLACGAGANCQYPSSLNSTVCRASTNGNTCGNSNVGVCRGITNPVCVQSLDSVTAVSPRQSISPSCRAYPEESSPFPNSKTVGESLAFDSVNLCNESTGFNTDPSRYNRCECSYTKATYGDSIIKYWGFTSPNNEGVLNRTSQLIKGVVNGICSGGDNVDRVCNLESDCPNGSCQKAKKESRLIGWQGYCIEPDFSRPLNAEQNSFACLTWLPKDSITGAYDINNQHVEAGFQTTASNGKYYCLQGRGRQTDQNDTTQVPGPAWGIGGTRYTYDKYLDSGNMGQGQNDSTDRKKRVLTVWDPTSQIHRDEIDYILISPSGDGDWFPSGGYRSFFIRNGLITKYNGAAPPEVVSKNGNSGAEVAIPDAQLLTGEATSIPPGHYVWSDGRDTNFWYMRYDNGRGDGDDQFQFADPYAAVYPGVPPYADLLIGPNTRCRSVDIDEVDEYQDGCLGGNTDNNDAGCAIRVVFDTNGMLNRINFVCFIGDESKNRNTSFRIYAGLRESCNYISQTEEAAYTSVGWTDRLWQTNLPYVIGSGGLNYRKSTISPPFGSLAMPGLLIPDQLVHIFSHYNETTFNPPPAIAGSPYGCGGFLTSGQDCLRTNPTPDETIRGPASGRNSTQARAALSQIFARIESMWGWNYVNSSYDHFITRDDDFTESLTSAIRAPQVHPLGACKPGDKCLESSALGMSINGLPNGNVVFNNNVALVTAKFYGFVDKDQMPIKKMKIDWGDQSIVSLDGYFRNHRGMVNGTCGSNRLCLVQSSAAISNRACVRDSDCQFLDNCFPETQAPNFGQILGKSCDSAYFRFDHVYQCVRDGEGWTNSCPDVQAQSLYGGCCSFQPKVQLKDNWGWCNGSCGNAASAGGTGCYNAIWKAAGTDECETLTGAFTPFVGNIIVVPSE